MNIYTLRTTIGRENMVISEIETRVKTRSYNIKALIHPKKLKGYILIEGEETDIREAIHDLRHVKGLISKPVDVEKIKHFLETKKIKIEVNKGDVVEIIGGPFKNEKGKILRMSKNEVTMELLEAAVSIPVTVSLDSIRVLEKASEKSKEGK